jgi:hypothetical protein
MSSDYPRFRLNDWLSEDKDPDGQCICSRLRSGLRSRGGLWRSNLRRHHPHTDKPREDRITSSVVSIVQNMCGKHKRAGQIRNRYCLSSTGNCRVQKDNMVSRTNLTPCTSQEAWLSSPTLPSWAILLAYLRKFETTGVPCRACMCAGGNRLWARYHPFFQTPAQNAKSLPATSLLCATGFWLRGTI